MEGSSAQMNSEIRLGKTPPFWVPDTDSDLCMQCQLKFTMIRRRHHCRACGLVLCSKCCCLKAPLEYMEFQEARVCQPCFTIIFRVGEDQRFQGRQPNPNNPMDYCSTIPPLQQAASSLNQPPPSVLVPSGVLKREGRAKSDVPKQVMFSDGIRPGGDLTELDAPSESRILPKRSGRRLASPGGGSRNAVSVIKRPLDPVTQSFIPSTSTDLPPLVTHDNAQLVFLEDVPSISETPVKYAVNNNLFVHVKRVKLECCVNRECWSICSEGLAIVGQDEVALVLECLKDELLPPQDVFHFINTLYLEGIKGSTVSEMSYTPSFSSNMLGSKDHGGFLYIRPTFQCTTNLLLPQQPYIIAILVHRWETPWARLFPLRLILRLGAEYRYYPCPLISIRNRPPLYTDIGHTVMKILVDFRKYSYSLATVRGLLIHMEDRQTTILFPRNRYDQVVRALNNSNDSVLAFGANLSLSADSHLVCIQGTKDENSYHTQAINIHNKPRKVTGASFVVFNGALKTAGLSGKTSIVEDGLMVQLPSDSMVALRTALRDMKDFTISCGPNDEETVNLRWSADDTNFNVGVKSVIDGKELDGVPSIRVHSGTDYGSNRIIRWTEVFIVKSEDERKARDPLDISKVSESVARATCLALVQDLESLVRVGVRCLGIRANIHPDSVGYEAGSNEVPLPQTNMNRLDEELIPVLHQAATSAQDTLILELVFRIIDHM
uniref:Zinc finger FYVE domain-containing protein 9 n=1 Tax=Lygus hesperus TaxID=30085 RepID=A0A0A9ZF36_LYGHE